MRLFLSAALAVCLCGLSGARDDKKDEKATPAEKLKALQKEFNDAQQPILKEFREAKSDKEKQEAIAKFRELGPKIAEKALALAAETPKDPASFDAAVMAFQMGGDGAVGAKAGDFLVANHADNPKLKSMLGMFAGGPGGEKMLQTLADKATDKGVKGAALYYMATAKVEAADGGDPKQTAEKRAAAMKDAETSLQKVAKEYGDVELGGRRGESQTIAKAVEDQIFFINNLTIGKVLPDSVCEDLDGKKVKISDYRGKVVVLDIWATWCGPCVAMIPHERELVKKLKDKPFTFISLSADDEKETLVKFIEKEPMPWTHWWNGKGKGPVETYKVRFFPTIYVLDEKGVIRFKHVREAAMDKAVEELLKDLKPKG